MPVTNATWYDFVFNCGIYIPQADLLLLGGTTHGDDGYERACVYGGTLNLKNGDFTSSAVLSKFIETAKLYTFGGNKSWTDTWNSNTPASYTLRANRVGGFAYHSAINRLYIVVGEAENITFYYCDLNRDFEKCNFKIATNDNSDPYHKDSLVGFNTLKLVGYTSLISHQGAYFEGKFYQDLFMMTLLSRKPSFNNGSWSIDTWIIDSYSLRLSDVPKGFRGVRYSPVSSANIDPYDFGIDAFYTKTTYNGEELPTLISVNNAIGEVIGNKIRFNRKTSPDINHASFGYGTKASPANIWAIAQISYEHNLVYVDYQKSGGSEAFDTLVVTDELYAYIQRLRKDTLAPFVVFPNKQHRLFMLCSEKLVKDTDPTNFKQIMTTPKLDGTILRTRTGGDIILDLTADFQAEPTVTTNIGKWNSDSKEFYLGGIIPISINGRYSSYIYFGTERYAAKLSVTMGEGSRLRPMIGAMSYPPNTIPLKFIPAPTLLSGNENTILDPIDITEIHNPGILDAHDASELFREVSDADGTMHLRILISTPEHTTLTGDINNPNSR